MSDPLNIRSLFEDASKEVDRLLPVPGHNLFGEARTMVHDFLNEAKAGGHIESLDHREMTVVLPVRNKEKFWIKGPQFDLRYSGRKKPPSCDFTIEIRCSDKGVMGLEFNPLGSEGTNAISKYSAKKGWTRVLKNPGSFSDINEAPIQAYMRQIAEQLVFAGRFFTQRADKKADIAAPGMEGP